ncbi:type I restriction endonuclease [Cloacibacillus evryensis]|uniref:type I restriction endonuclease n=1 Tax=Cloacibacillus evryensis TaxID=508460 RepID=UPI00210B07EF|nr:type I restriction endonuclease [Cloacibacillus evryensis]MCQ4764789.1 type I restriction enzyme HsdR N-terminal domain-containing protein [Cloacibacillus evryensis]
MELIDAIKVIAQRNKNMGASIQTEEAAKTALVMPFIQALGYDVFNPAEVVPEFVADIVDRKGEKIDYAIMKDNEPIMLIECKWNGGDLTQDHRAQLARYFMVVPARIGILTNGVEYEFYADLDESKQLDTKPFLKFNINDVNEVAIRELKKYSKGAFRIDAIIPAAEELKYTNEMKNYLADMLADPDEGFTRLLTKQVYDRKLTAPSLEKFKAITKKALSQFISDRVSDRLASALQEEKASASATPPVPTQETSMQENEKDKVVTTQEEIDAFNVIRAILCRCVPTERIAMRDTQSYCGIIFDDNNRLPICRLYFNSKGANIGIFDEAKKETKYPFESVSGLYNYSEQLLAVTEKYLNDKAEK